LKKFGILQITTDLVGVFIRNEFSWGKNVYKYERLMIISYLIPLLLVFWDIWRVHKKLKQVKKSFGL
jgi:hypothetical protein